MNRSASMAAGLLFLVATLPLQAQQAPVDATATRPAMARVDMQNYSRASRIGYAEVFRPEGTDVVVQVPPVNGLTRPMHLYTYVHQGSCASLGPRMIEATRRVLGYHETTGLWSVRNTIPLSVDTVRASPHALTVWSGPPDGDQMLYCGDLRLS